MRQVEECLDRLREENRRLQKYLRALEVEKETHFAEFVNVGAGIDDEQIVGGLSLEVISEALLAEVRAYTANELFKIRKKTESLYSEFAKVKEMKRGVELMKRDMGLTNMPPAPTETMMSQLDTQFEILRKQLLKSQARHGLLKRLKQTLQVLAQAPSAQLERQLVKDYKAAMASSQDAHHQIRQDLNGSMLSDLSQLTGGSCGGESTYSETFFDKWRGLLYTAADSSQTSKFMDPMASWMLPASESAGCRQVSRLQRELRELQMMRPSRVKAGGRYC